MKFKHLFFGMFAAAAFSACSNEDDNAPNINGGVGELETNYMQVKLSYDIESTRADQFENGLDAENAITKVRFYFFDEDGKPAKVIGNGTQPSGDPSSPNYTPYDTSTVWVNHIEIAGKDITATGQTNGGSVEEILNTMLLIQSPKDEIPASVVAIINPTDKDPAENLSRELWSGSDNVFLDYASPELTKSGAFVMTNAVYAPDNSTVQEDVPVTGYLKPTRELALANPLTIQVERSCAKVVMDNNMDAPNENGVYNIGEVDDETVPEAEREQVYLKLLGWDVTRKVNAAHLVKNINAGWAYDLFGNTELWNSTNLKRSYWAYDHIPAASSPIQREYIFKSFNKHYTDSPSFDAPAEGDTLKNWVYVNENAAVDENGATRPEEQITELIIVGQLTDEEGNAVTIVEAMGIRMKEETFKSKIATNSFISTIQVDGKKLTFDDFKYITKTEKEGKTEPDEDTDDRYEVFMRLKNPGTKIEQVTKVIVVDSNGVPTGEETEERKPLTEAQLNTMLDTHIGPISYWKNGATYYYININHLGAEGKPGEFGIVRNHVYKMNLTSILGLGTPVYDPTQKIIPEKPKGKESYLAAEIKILAWRIVKQDLKLEW